MMWLLLYYTFSLLHLRIGLHQNIRRKNNQDMEMKFYALHTQTDTIAMIGKN